MNGRPAAGYRDAAPDRRGALFVFAPPDVMRTLASGTRIIELISSPMALVEKAFGGGDWEPAPDRFPMPGLAAPAGAPVETVTNFTSTDNQFMTLEFYGNPGTVHVVATGWQIADHGPPTRVVTYKFKI